MTKKKHFLWDMTANAIDETMLRRRTISFAGGDDGIETACAALVNAV